MGVSKKNWKKIREKLGEKGPGRKDRWTVEMHLQSIKKPGKNACRLFSPNRPAAENSLSMKKSS